MNFNAETTREFRAELEDVLAKAFPDLRFRVGRMTYDRAGDNVNMALEAIAGQSRAEKDLADAMVRDGVLSITATDGSELVEYSRRARKYPYIFRNPEGKLMKMSVELARAKFGVRA